MAGRYKFDKIFYVNYVLGIIVPRFTVIINNTRFAQGASINRSTSFGGLNLFNYIGREIAGEWNATARELTILGFY